MTNKGSAIVRELAAKRNLIVKDQTLSAVKLVRIEKSKLDTVNIIL